MSFSHLDLSDKPFAPSSLLQVTTPLSELKEFNPALVYGFVPEDPHLHSYKKDSVAFLLHICGQVRDMQNAYFYAQNSILTDIRKNGLKTITPEKIGTWLTQLHILIAKTLADEVDTTPGILCSGTYRWKGKEATDRAFLIQLYSGGINLDAVASENGFEKSKVLAFIKLFRPLQKKHGKDALEHLLKLHQNNKLTPEEKTAVDHLFFMAYRPEKLKMLITVFQAELAKKWQACDANNDDEIAKLAAYAYTNIAGKIHCYFNANGRLATCVVNIILRSFNKPSILVRYPHERHDPESAYQITLKNAANDPEAFAKHFKNRMQEKSPYSDKKLADLVVHRDPCAAVYAKILHEFPDQNLDALEMKHNIEFRDSSMKQFLLLTMQKIAADPNGDIDKIEAELDEEMKIPCYVSKLPWLEKTLRKLRDKPLIAHFIQHLQQPNPTTKKLVGLLSNLTGERGWLVYGTDNITVLLYLDNEEKANAIVTNLKNTEAMKVTLLKDPSVIEIKEINTEKLRACLDKNESKLDYVEIKSIS